MAATAHKEQPSSRTFQPVLNLPDRRHSLAHPVAAAPEPNARRGSTVSTSSRKKSDTPAWYTSINERNNSVGSNPETARRSSLADGVKGIFGRKKSVDEGGGKSKKSQPIVITSKHAAKIKNVLRADPRGARKEPAVKGAGIEGTQHSTHLSAKEQEERRPHSGPPAMHADLPMLTRIQSEDEYDSEEERNREKWKDEEDDDPFGQPYDATQGNDVVDGKKTQDQAEMAKIEEEDLVRRRSSAGRSSVGSSTGPRSPRKSVFGGWSRDETGTWKRR